MFRSDKNGNKDEVTPSGSVTPDRTIFKPGQGQSEAQMVPPLQSDPDDPILIQQAEVASEITGKKANTPPSSSPFATQSRPLDLHVSAEIKAKIWSHKYVDLTMLVPREDSEDYTYCFQEGSGGDTLTIKRTAKKVTINNVDEWCAAFSIFMYIYCTKYASAAPALVKYVEHVRKMARRGQDWKYYDKHFRLGQQTEYLPWDYINWEAMNEAQYRTQPFRGHFYEQSNSSNTNNGKAVPNGYCRRFHSALGCVKSSCQFSHACYLCSGQHTAWLCTKPGSSNSSGK